MKCPSCSKTAITYLDWIKGLRWHKTSCITCGSKLKATTRVYAGFVLSVFFGTSVALYLKITFGSSRLVAIPVAIGIVFIIATVIYYFVKGYKIAK